MKKHYDGILFNLIEFLQVQDLLSAKRWARAKLGVCKTESYMRNRGLKPL